MRKAFFKFLILLICAIFSGLVYLLLHVSDNFSLGRFVGNFSLLWMVFWMIALLTMVLIFVHKVKFSIPHFLTISFFLLIALPLLHKVLPSRLNIGDEFVLYKVFSKDEDARYPDLNFCPIRCEGAKNIHRRKEIIFSNGKTKFATTEYSYRLAIFCGYFDQSDKCCKGKGLYIDTLSEILFFPKLVAEVMFSCFPAMAFIFLIIWTYE